MKKDRPWKSQVAVSGTSNTFLGTPSLAVDSSGVMWVSFNYFGSATTTNTSDIYRSSDGGASWIFVRQIVGLYHAKYFIHGGLHYLLGTSGSRGDLVLWSSSDEWASAPSSITIEAGNFVMSSLDIAEKDGFLFFSVNDVGSASPTVFSDYEASVLFADTTALTNPASWRRSNNIRFDQSWTGAQSAGPRAFIEGNIVLDDGQLKSIWRTAYSSTNVAGLIDLTWDSATPSLSISFDSSTGFVDFPGGALQFPMMFDATLDKWITLANHDGYGLLGRDALESGQTDPNQIRHELWLCSADDLAGPWTPMVRVLRDEIENPISESVSRTGFQYVSMDVVGDDLRFVSRTAYDGASSEHDSNRITYHEIVKFRDLFGGTEAELSSGVWPVFATLSIDAATITTGAIGAPVVLDLRDITDVAFWDAVREDGGDIRVSNAGGNEVPAYLIEFCRQSHSGQLVVRADVSADQNTVLNLWSGNSLAKAYSATHQYGQQAVWFGDAALALHTPQHENVNATGLTGNSSVSKANLSRMDGYWSLFTNQSDIRYARIPHATELSNDFVTTGFTLELLIKPGDLSGGDTFSTTNPRYVITKSVTTVDITNYAIRLLGNRVDFMYRSGGSFVSCRQDTGNLVEDQTHHIAATHDGSTVNIYVDGVLVPSTFATGSATDAPTINASDIIVGAQFTTGSDRAFDGNVQFIGVHSTVRSAAWLSARASAMLAYAGTSKSVSQITVDQIVSEIERSGGMMNLIETKAQSDARQTLLMAEHAKTPGDGRGLFRKTLTPTAAVNEKDETTTKVV